MPAKETDALHVPYERSDKHYRIMCLNRLYDSVVIFLTVACVILECAVAIEFYFADDNAPNLFVFIPLVSLMGISVCCCAVAAIQRYEPYNARRYLCMAFMCIACVDYLPDQSSENKRISDHLDQKNVHLNAQATRMSPVELFLDCKKSLLQFFLVQYLCQILPQFIIHVVVIIVYQEMSVAMTICVVFEILLGMQFLLLIAIADDFQGLMFSWVSLVTDYAFICCMCAFFFYGNARVTNTNSNADINLVWDNVLLLYFYKSAILFTPIMVGLVVIIYKRIFFIDLEFNDPAIDGEYKLHFIYKRTYRRRQEGACSRLVRFVWYVLVGCLAMLVAMEFATFAVLALVLYYNQTHFLFDSRRYYLNIQTLLKFISESGAHQTDEILRMVSANYTITELVWFLDDHKYIQLLEYFNDMKSKDKLNVVTKPDIRAHSSYFGYNYDYDAGHEYGYDYEYENENENDDKNGKQKQKNTCMCIDRNNGCCFKCMKYYAKQFFCGSVLDCIRTYTGEATRESTKKVFLKDLKIKRELTKPGFSYAKALQRKRKVLLNIVQVQPSASNDDDEEGKEDDSDELALDNIRMDGEAVIMEDMSLKTERLCGCSVISNVVLFYFIIPVYLLHKLLIICYPIIMVALFSASATVSVLEPIHWVLLCLYLLGVVFLLCWYCVKLKPQHETLSYIAPGLKWLGLYNLNCVEFEARMNHNYREIYWMAEVRKILKRKFGVDIASIIFYYVTHMMDLKEDEGGANRTREMNYGNKSWI